VSKFVQVEVQLWCRQIYQRHWNTHQHDKTKCWL